MKKNSGLPDYCNYRFEKKELMGAVLLGAAVLAALAILFYRSLWAMIILSPIGIWMVRSMQEKKRNRIQTELEEQFKECILSVSASLQAGYAVENAFLESREDMRNLYGENSFIFGELEGFRRGFVINIPLEELLMDFGRRSGSDEIVQFANLFAVAKRGGGNIPGLIRTSANLISQKIEARQEIQITLSGRKMEQNIMRLMPMGILLYVGNSYPGYFDPLYHNLEGIAIMSVCLGLYLAAVFMGEKIMRNIELQLQGKVKEEGIPGLKKKGIVGKFALLGEQIFKQIRAKAGTRNIAEKIRRNLEVLCPEEAGGELLVRYFGGKIGLAILIVFMGTVLAIILQVKARMSHSQESTGYIIWLLSAMAAAVTFVLMDKDLEDRVKQRKEVMKLAYPDIVHGLTLYLVAGVTVRGAFQKLSEKCEPIRHACREMQAGVSEITAYEHFGKRAGPREYVRLSTLLCQNVKKGNATLLNRLEEEAMGSAESRIQSGKRLGEEAGTKLLIPMVMLLGVVMIMIMIPAFWVMGV